MSTDSESGVNSPGTGSTGSESVDDSGEEPLDQAATLRSIEILQSRLKQVDPVAVDQREFETLAAAVIESEHSRGPLPTPKFLRDYEDIYPGAAHIIFSEFEKQGAHRRSVERDLLERQNRRADRGQWWAGSIATAALAAAVVCILSGEPGAGAVLFSGALATIVLGFLGSTGRFDRLTRARTGSANNSKRELRTQTSGANPPSAA